MYSNINYWLYMVVIPVRMGDGPYIFRFCRELGPSALYGYAAVGYRTI